MTKDHSWSERAAAAGYCQGWAVEELVSGSNWEPCPGSTALAPEAAGLDKPCAFPPGLPWSSSFASNWDSCCFHHNPSVCGLRLGVTGLQLSPAF